MIPEIWTLQAANGGPERTLSDWGFVGASLSRANQAADVLTLTSTPEDALTAADLWDWETEIILRRSGEVYYRGYLADNPLSLAHNGETVTHVFRSLWWLLERLDFQQEVESMTATGFAPVETSRVRMESATVADMVGELVSWCASMGVPLAVSLSGVASARVPAIEAHNRSVAELLREIWNWLPGTALVASYSAAGTQYVAAQADAADVVSIPLGDRPLAEAKIRALYERQVDKVRVIYEASAPYESGDVASEAGFRRANVLIAKEDSYPTSAPTTRRTLTVTLPHPAARDGMGIAPQPQVTCQPVATESWPQQGAYDGAAEQWWLDRSGLGSLGLTSNDIRLPRESDETTVAHRVILDPAVPLEDPPSAVNPNATPVWRPPSAEDVPRELMAGSLSDWMNVSAAMLIAQATIAVRKSTADGLSEPNKSAFMRLGPREVSSIAGVDVAAYLIDAQYRFRGTDAVTKVYRKTLSIDHGDAAANAEAYASAVEAAVVPGLAQRLYEALSPLYFAGNVTLSAEEAPADSHMARSVRLLHPSRPAWATMRAEVQSEDVDLTSGTVGLTLGPPEHLSPQDWVALHAAARTAQDRRATAALPAPPGPPEPPEDGSDEANPTIGGTFTPMSEFAWMSGGTAAAGGPWQIKVADGGVSVAVGTILRGDDNVSLVVSCENPEELFDPAEGSILAIKIEDLAPTSYSLVALESWPEESGAAVSFTGEVGDSSFEFEARHYPLWQFRPETATAGAVPIRDGLVGVRLAPPSHLVIHDSLYRTPDGEVFVAPRFGLSHAAIT